MALQVEHELHRRRLGRNVGLGLVLLGFAALVFGLTVVKILTFGDVRAVEDFDHVSRPELAEPAAPAGTE